MSRLSETQNLGGFFSPTLRNRGLLPLVAPLSLCGVIKIQPLRGSEGTSLNLHRALFFDGFVGLMGRMGVVGRLG